MLALFNLNALVFISPGQVVYQLWAREDHGEAYTRQIRTVDVRTELYKSLILSFQIHLRDGTDLTIKANDFFRSDGSRVVLDDQVLAILNNPKIMQVLLDLIVDLADQCGFVLPADGSTRMQRLFSFDRRPGEAGAFYVVKAGFDTEMDEAIPF